jgi:hypothetical protein
MCSVCVAAAQVVADFLATYQYEISHRPEVQLQHASVHGFCSLHSWQYDRLASPRGVCSAYPVVLQKIARELLESCELSEAVSIVEQVQLSSEHCPACEVQRKTENAVLQKLAASIGEFGGVLCLPHLRLLLRQLDSKMIRTLVARHGEILQRIAEDMQRFVLKHDGLRRDLISEEEKQAHHQGLALLVGDRRLASSLPREVWL